MNSDTLTILKQFEPIEIMYAAVKPTFTYDTTRSYAELTLAESFVTVAMSCIQRIAGRNSPYEVQASRIMSDKKNFVAQMCQSLYGVVQGLKQDVANGYLASLRELVHADLFADFLESAEYFLTEGYKDPAAVMVGGVLEEHLRQLCNKNGIDTEVPDTRQPTKMNPKKAEALNADLAKANVYGKLEQKQVTAWLDIRNKAAHALYGEYDNAQVVLFLQGLRNFIAKYPA